MLVAAVNEVRLLIIQQLLQMIQADPQLISGFDRLHIFPQVLTKLVPRYGRIQQQIDEQILSASSAPAAEDLRIIHRHLKWLQQDDL
ncbi:hypothetical protein D3C80_1307770 [compost metagenome]